MDKKIVSEMLKEVKIAGIDISNYHQLWALKSRHKFLTPILLRYIEIIKKISNSK